MNSQTASANVYKITKNRQFVGKFASFTHEVIDRRARSAIVDVHETKVLRQKL